MKLFSRNRNNFSLMQWFKADAPGCWLVVWLLTLLCITPLLPSPWVHLYGLLVQAVYFVGIFFLLRSKLRKEAICSESLVNVFLLSSIGVCLLGILQYMNYGLIVRSLKLPPSDELWGFYLIDWVIIPIQHAHARVYSLFYAPPMYGLYLAMLLPLSLYRLQTSQSRKAMSLWGLIVLMILLNLLMSFTRIAWIAAVFACLFYLMRSGSRKLWQILLAGSALLVGLSLLWPPLWQHAWQRITSIASFSHQSNAGRLEIWSKSWQVILQRPLTGHGFFSFWQIFPQWRWHWPHSHSFLLQSLLETGMIATGCFYGFLISCARQWQRQALHWACACAMLAFLICAWVDHPAYDARNFFIFCVLLAIGTSESSKQKLNILQ